MKNSTKYVYSWGNNEKRVNMKNRVCEVLAYGKKNSCQIRFTDTGQCEIVSRYSLKRKDPVVADLYQLTSKYACAGVEVDENHVIVKTAPIYKWMRGKKARYCIDYLKERGLYRSMVPVKK